MKIDKRNAQIERAAGTESVSEPVPAVAPTAKVEHKSVTMPMGGDLTEHGADGWELVAVVQKPYDPSHVVAYFKRKA